MKRKLAINLIVVCLVLVVLLCVGCNNETTPPTQQNPPEQPTPDVPIEPDVPVVPEEPVIVVSATEQSVKIWDTKLSDVDFTAYFSVTVDGAPLQVTTEMLDLSGLPTAVGTGSVVCTYEGFSATLTVVVEQYVSYAVTANTYNVQIVDEQLNDYNFSALFSVKANGAIVLVTEDMLTLSESLKNGQNGSVTCSYQGKSATVFVEIIPTVYDLVLSIDSIEVGLNRLEDQNFLQYFTATRNGEVVEITQDMVVSNVQNQTGSYTYSVTFKNITKTLTVLVSNKFDIQLNASYPKGLQLEQNQVEGFDLTSLFYLYVDDVAVQIIPQMIEGSITNTVGSTSTITCSYSQGDSQKTVSTTVTVVDVVLPVITSRDVEIYPIETSFDITTLFSISYKGENIPVTLEMLSGSMVFEDGTQNVITLTYMGQTATATVTIKRGVTISLPNGSNITVSKGTNKFEYDFASDFAVTINGMEFTYFYQYIDTSGVDFSTVGSYTATLTIPYNTGSITSSGANFTNYTEQITYNVVENNYKIEVLQDLVTIKDISNYNPFTNLVVQIQRNYSSGSRYVKQSLVTEKSWANNNNNCYATVDTTIDATSIAVQNVVVSVYVNGPEQAPVVVSFDVQIASGIKVVAHDRVAFTGETVLPSQLFEITQNGENVQVSADMLTGKVDTFIPGIYKIHLDYFGYKATAQVIVYSDALKGLYTSPIKTIATESTEDSDGYVEAGQASTLVGNLVFNTDGTITVGSRKATIVSAIDQSTMLIKIGSTNYNLHYDNGIIVVDPINTYNMSFNNDSRPLVFFNKEIWTISGHFVLGSSDQHVLQLINPGYSIECILITNNQTQQSLWYALSVDLLSKTSSDYVYQVSWGEIDFGEEFEPQKGVEAQANYNGKQIDFEMTSDTWGRKQNAVVDTTGYGTYTGIINGQSARLIISNNCELYFGTSRYFSAYQNTIASDLIYVGFDVDSGVATLFNYINLKTQPMFSYQFALDMDNLTFEVLPHTDNLLGVYVYEDKLIFLDGYGHGIVNYDTTGYAKYKIDYTVIGNSVKIVYQNTNALFPYGTDATFTLSEMGNTLKVKDITGVQIPADALLINQVITSGAIVIPSSTTIRCETETEGKAMLYEQFKVITANGELTLEDKQKAVWRQGGRNVYCFDVSKINFNQDGFYQFTINLLLDGQKVTNYYAVQVIKPSHAENPLVATYGNGIIGGRFSIAIDKYGIVALTANDIRYTGQMRTDASGEMLAYLSDGTSKVILKATLFTQGILYVRATGSVSFNDYFTTGTTNVIGGEGVVLRETVIDGNTIYTLGNNPTAITISIVKASAISGSMHAKDSIIQITDGSKVIYAKIAEWGNAQKGLVLSDEVRGEYQNSEIGTLALDGFGNATLNGNKGTYVINDPKTVMVNINQDFAVYSIDNDNFLVYNILLNNTLLQKANFSATYLCISSDDSTSYTVTTSFAFDGNGGVIVTSTADDVSDDEGYVVFTYQPIFVGNGTYNLVGNVVTINVKGQTFTFEIPKVVYPTQLICTSTTLTSQEQGYFSVGATFNR